MHFHDQERPRLGNGRPTWISAQIALPHVMLDPLADGTWMVAIMTQRPGSPDSHAWATQKFTLAELELFFHSWRHDPEDTLTKMFHHPLPTQFKLIEQPAVVSTTASLEDLDL